MSCDSEKRRRKSIRRWERRRLVHRLYLLSAKWIKSSQGWEHFHNDQLYCHDEIIFTARKQSIFEAGNPKRRWGRIILPCIQQESRRLHLKEVRTTIRCDKASSINLCILYAVHVCISIWSRTHLLIYDIQLCDREANRRTYWENVVMQLLSQS